MRNSLLSLAFLGLLASGAVAQEEGTQQIGPVNITGTGGSQPGLGASYTTSILNPHTQAQWKASVAQAHQQLDMVLTQDVGKRLQAELNATESWDGGVGSSQLGAELTETDWQAKVGGSVRPDGWYEVHLSSPVTAWWASKFTLNSDGTKAVSLESPTTSLSAQLQGETVQGTLRQKLRGRPTWLELDATYKGSDLQELDAGCSYKLGSFAVDAKAGRIFIPEMVDSIKGDLKYSW